MHGLQASRSEAELEEMCCDAPEMNLALKSDPEPSCHSGLWQKRQSGWGRSVD